MPIFNFATAVVMGVRDDILSLVGQHSSNLHFLGMVICYFC